LGLYLCVFTSAMDDDEVDGLEVGSYDDFFGFRSAVAAELEGGAWGSRFPVLMSHSDADGEWSSVESAELLGELRIIAEELADVPARGFDSGTWQSAVAKMVGIMPTTRADNFIDVDGEPLLARLMGLAEAAASRGLPISFQ
jgi:hypothetical protein